jgi:hypothetical protein
MVGDFPQVVMNFNRFSPFFILSPASQRWPTSVHYGGRSAHLHCSSTSTYVIISSTFRPTLEEDDEEEELRSPEGAGVNRVCLFVEHPRAMPLDVKLLESYFVGSIHYNE